MTTTTTMITVLITTTTPGTALYALKEVDSHSLALVFGGKGEVACGDVTLDVETGAVSYSLRHHPIPYPTPTLSLPSFQSLQSTPFFLSTSTHLCTQVLLLPEGEETIVTCSGDNPLVLFRCFAL
jgi:hypothetical protein